MKKISYSLHFGIIGSINSGKQILLDYLGDLAIEFDRNNEDDNEKGYHELLIVHKRVPIKIKVHIANYLNELMHAYEKIKRLDVLIFVLNMAEKNSINDYTLDKFKNFCEYSVFQGLTILIGIRGPLKSENQISKGDLINKAKNLNMLYCFEIQDKLEDIQEIFDKILNDFIFKFQFSSQELFERATEYGKKLYLSKRF